MNNRAIQCDDERLMLLLEADEPDIEHDPWVEHVEHCGQCQSRLRELAADDDAWQKATAVLSASDIEDAMLRRGHQVSSPSSDTLAKHLLQPPSHPEMLGRLGRYEIERTIGSGGMGIVFKAFDTELNRVVAIKVLAPHLAAIGSAKKRFARESRAAAGVRDDHVVQIFNVESENDPPFLVMQYVAGGSLQEKVDRDGPLEPSEILRIGFQAASGLAAAHAQGLIHRDIKPSNILLDHCVERALLTDFGLARTVDDASLTRSGFHPGTPHYMSPEQVRGEALDGRSDLFSLGCVLYALCTGHSPFRSESTYAVLRRVTDDIPRSIRQQNPDIPEWLERIVFKLLAKSAHDRFESAEQVTGILRDCLAHLQQPASAGLPDVVHRIGSAASDRPAKMFSTPGKVLRDPTKRNKWLLAMTTAAALALAGLCISWLGDRDTRPVNSIKPVPPDAPALTAAAPDNPPENPPIRSEIEVRPYPGNDLPEELQPNVILNEVSELSDKIFGNPSH